MGKLGICEELTDFLLEKWVSVCYLQVLASTKSLSLPTSTAARMRGAVFLMFHDQFWDRRITDYCRLVLNNVIGLGIGRYHEGGRETRRRCDCHMSYT